MKRSTKFALATVAALGVAAVAVPVVAQQGQMQHDGMMDGSMGMMGQHGGMMGGSAMGGGMMGGQGAGPADAMGMMDRDMMRMMMMGSGMMGAGALAASVSGSGSAVYGVFATRQEAERATGMLPDATWATTATLGTGSGG